VEDRLFSNRVWEEGESRVLVALSGFHEKNPLKPGMSLEELRQVLPGSFGPKLAEGILQTLVGQEGIALTKGTASLASFKPTLSGRQTSIRAEVKGLLAEAGLAPPSTRELGETLGAEGEVEGILRLMEADGEVIGLDGEFFFQTGAVWDAGRAVVRELAGLKDLGPAAFREVLPVSRRHLLPILRYFDLVGVTTRMGDGRDVAPELPDGWGTPGSLKQ
jgi:selenocysteine-specific elongation factor